MSQRSKRSSTVGVRLEPELREKADAAAQEQGVTLSHLIRTILEKHFGLKPDGGS